MLILSNNRYRFIAYNYDGNNFYLAKQSGYFMSYDVILNKFKLDKTPNVKFSIDKNGFLKTGEYFIYWSIDLNNQETTLMPTSRYNRKNVKAIPEYFDFRELKYQGGYALILNGGLNNEDNKLLRILKPKYFHNIEQSNKDKLSEFCLFSNNDKIHSDLIISEYKKCLNISNFEDYSNKRTFIEFLNDFKKLFDSQLVTSEIGFVHLDIKTSNIVIDIIDENNYVFKYIDFDLSLFKNIKQKYTLFRDKKLHSMFPTLINIILIYIFKSEDKNVEIYPSTDFNEYIDLFISQFSFCGIEELLCENINANSESLIEAKVLFDKYDKDIIINYVTTYQLIVVFVHYVGYWETSLFNENIFNYLDVFLNFKKHGIFSTNEYVEMFSQMVSQIILLSK